MEKYIPDIYQQSIYTINYQKLKESGIKCLLFDLDNTLVPNKIKVATKKLKDLIKELQKDFKIIIFSNANKNRVNSFVEQLNIEGYHLCAKPFSKRFNMILEKYDYNISEVAIIGDQILTDIVGGNGVGITTLLVNPISPVDGIFTKFNRFLEKRIMIKLSNNDLFYKGRYYE